MPTQIPANMQSRPLRILDPHNVQSHENMGYPTFDGSLLFPKMYTPSQHSSATLPAAARSRPAVGMTGSTVQQPRNINQVPHMTRDDEIHGNLEEQSHEHDPYIDSLIKGTTHLGPYLQQKRRQGDSSSLPAQSAHQNLGGNARRVRGPVRSQVRAPGQQILGNGDQKTLKRTFDDVDSTVDIDGGFGFDAFGFDAEHSAAPTRRRVLQSRPVQPLKRTKTSHQEVQARAESLLDDEDSEFEDQQRWPRHFQAPRHWSELEKYVDDYQGRPADDPWAFPRFPPKKYDRHLIITPYGDAYVHFFPVYPDEGCTGHTLPLAPRLEAPQPLQSPKRVRGPGAVAGRGRAPPSQAARVPSSQAARAPPSQAARAPSSRVARGPRAGHRLGTVQKNPSRGARKVEAVSGQNASAVPSNSVPSYQQNTQQPTQVHNRHDLPEIGTPVMSADDPFWLPNQEIAELPASNATPQPRGQTGSEVGMPMPLTQPAPSYPAVPPAYVLPSNSNDGEVWAPLGATAGNVQSEALVTEPVTDLDNNGQQNGTLCAPSASNVEAGILSNQLTQQENMQNGHQAAWQDFNNFLQKYPWEPLQAEFGVGQGMDLGVAENLMPGEYFAQQNLTGFPMPDDWNADVE